ncbi:histidine--tRNA ligase [bacterium]|nr:histidine--tRNA ligase [bacterium]
MAKTAFQLPKGTRDILPEEQPYWAHLNAVIREITDVYQYARLDVPVFEETALFQRGVGEATDIVEKEMYTFTDKGQNSITLRPEFTAGVIRSYIQNGMSSLPTPVKVWSTGPVFRYERPQSGRFRQFHQFNAEAIGDKDPVLDFEIMDMAFRLYQRLGFQKLSFQLNSIGCPECRPVYLGRLVDYYRGHTAQLCEDCKKRLDKNPLRLLDCKQDMCQPVIAGAPPIVQHLCDECNRHFKALCLYLDSLNRPYTLNHRLVRGLDYYTKTVFEVWAEGIGSQNAVCGGGRYDGLIELLGGQPTPSVGFAAGLERIVMMMQQQQIPVPGLPGPVIYFACQHQEAQKQALIYLSGLRDSGIAGLVGLGGRSFKAQFREANRRQARYVVTLGDTELGSSSVLIKHMETGDQETIQGDQLIRYITEHGR